MIDHNRPCVLGTIAPSLPVGRIIPGDVTVYRCAGCDAVIFVPLAAMERVRGREANPVCFACYPNPTGRREFTEVASPVGVGDQRPNKSAPFGRFVLG
jgi:hypothetical protein